MGLNLSSIHQRPYMAQDGRNLVKKKQEDDASRSAAQAQREEQASQNAKSKGLQYVENNQDGFTHSSGVVDSQPWQRELYKNAQTHQAQAATQKFANVNSTINIAQILKDFRNTAVAIGTPEDLKEEVNGYIELIEKQVTKDEPNKKLIKSNLKNASTILDNYISKTLDKESKVVENWVDALFMQDIDFKYNEKDINPQFLVKFPEGSTEPKETKSVEVGAKTQVEQAPPKEEVPAAPQAEQENSKVFVPQDNLLKQTFIKAKKLAYAKQPQKAIVSFNKAIERADEIGDTETKSKILYEIGKIYDDNNNLAQALDSYYQSIQTTSDDNVKTRAHYSMAQIYDDVNQIKPALEHYFVSVAYGGEADNKAAQSTSLAKMGNIFSDMYEDNAFEYLDMANDLAGETDNKKVKGFVSSSLGRAYERFGEPQKALKSYSEAVKNYSEAESPVKTAQNYLSAADIMLDFGSSNKARSLLNKAKQFAANTNDENLMNEIANRLATIS